MNQKALMAGKPGDIHHVGVIRLRQTDRLAAGLVEIDEMSGRLLEQHMAGQIRMCDTQRTRCQNPALHLRITAQIAQTLQRVSTALAPALGHTDRETDFRKVEGGLLTAKNFQNAQGLLYGLVEKRIGGVAVELLRRRALCGAAGALMWWAHAQ